ncbi:hypothetical protein FE257_004883 [Aspergillus nanangensis]|uniref:RGS domain-containing protein n=1 Tax=Aspergillus nanangensis TaxID=2582783 RepID=A0AAD4GMZ4_ASPNN|nr:hypothetical protein FE257_004883 [Aspergillus nanangensis]
MVDTEATIWREFPEPVRDQAYPAILPGPDDILSGSAPEPYTFDSFVDYLSQSHCIETLDFLSDAQVYIDSYRTSAASIRLSGMASESRRLGKQWKALMSTYIAPGAPDELNIPERISSGLLDTTKVMVSPPSPARLEPAIRHARQLLIESALIPFIQSHMVSSRNYRDSETVRNNENYRSNGVNGSNVDNGNNGSNGNHKGKGSSRDSSRPSSSVICNNNNRGLLPAGDNMYIPSYRTLRPQMERKALQAGGKYLFCDSACFFGAENLADVENRSQEIAKMIDEAVTDRFQNAKELNQAVK